MGGPGLCKPGPLPFRKAPEPSKHGKDEYLPVADEELDSLALESTHTIDIEKFVPSSEIDERYRDSPCYLTPEDHVGQDAFAVIWEAMTRKNMVAWAKPSSHVGNGSSCLNRSIKG